MSVTETVPHSETAQADKTAIVVLADPGSDEALGRLFNALFVTYELKEKGEDAALIFQGAGVRWAAELSKPDHPAHPLFNQLQDQLVGVCGGCADAFGAADDVATTNLPVIRQKEIPGVGGIIDLSDYLADGYRLLTF